MAAPFEDIDRYSSLEDLRGLYVEYGDYESRGDVNRCAIFMQAARGLLAKLASGATLGTESFQFRTDLIHQELADAKAWWRANARDTASTALDFGGYEVY